MDIKVSTKIDTGPDSVAGTVAAGGAKQYPQKSSMTTGGKKLIRRILEIGGEMIAPRDTYGSIVFFIFYIHDFQFKKNVFKRERSTVVHTVLF